ncbi:MAG: aromatic acid exporter family protein [Bacillaceae bacterium]|nr:aromatic acid exporter family protein [Bacillaceae bacterium]
MESFQTLRRLLPIGSRTLKTGISVFITALICQLLNLPVIFAVITAIVTVEHTAFDSIRKAMVRFPASAIGAFLAVSFYGLFGKSALTYALAAMLTIAVCHKLKLDEGIIVATLTAVAMIPEFQSHYLVSFFVRLGTTSIGIIVSTAVNFLLLPPDYTRSIYKNVSDLYQKTSDLLIQTSGWLLKLDTTKKHRLDLSYKQLTRQMEQTYNLIQYQREEWKYHKHSKNEMKVFQYAQKKLNLLQQILYHVGNLQYVELKSHSFNEDEKHFLQSIILSISDILKSSGHEIPDDHFEKIEKLDEDFWHWKDEHVCETPVKYKHHFPAETIVLYEILCLHDVLEELQELAKSRKHFSYEND